MAKNPPTDLRPLVVDAQQLAVLLGVSYSTMQKLRAERAWTRGQLPTPLTVGRGARRWRIAEVERWMRDCEDR